MLLFLVSIPHSQKNLLKLGCPEVNRQLKQYKELNCDL